MVKRDRLRAVFLAILIIMLWGLYFVVCSSPVGAPFIYVDF